MSATKNETTSVNLAGRLRRAVDRSASSELGRLRKSEPSMYPDVVGVLQELLPLGFEAISHSPEGTATSKPDIQITVGGSGALVAHIEVKHESTLDEAFRSKDNKPSQIDRYRQSGVPILLTDVLRWWDVTADNDLSTKIVDFSTDPDGSSSIAGLRSALHCLCGIRPQFNLNSAVEAIQGLVARISSEAVDALDLGWSIVRDQLGIELDQDSLDSDGPGEISAFTLLTIACNLSPLQDSEFVKAASEEWTNESRRWQPASLPTSMKSTLRLFRDEDGMAEGRLLGTYGWVTIRAVAAWLTEDASQDDRWQRLSNLWDAYLQTTGRRKNFGSWQTPLAVASHQAEEVANALESLGYNGLSDEAVTVLDPCCGTGVYLEAVVRQAQKEGADPREFNSSGSETYPRLLGFDILSTAVAATHIRLTSDGVRPSLYMTDTLATGRGRKELALFENLGARSANAIVAAAKTDLEEADQWARRQSDRDPVLVLIGNPPYQRSGLETDRYESMEWFADRLRSWASGSGGRGSLQDPFVGFWAWALTLCENSHPDLSPIDESATEQSACRPVGVVSFITNRSWIDTHTFRTMRGSILPKATTIRISDFGPGSRANVGGVWSEQPFDIETGTAIVTIVFDPKDTGASKCIYKKIRWRNGVVEPVDETYIKLTTQPIRVGKTNIAVSPSWITEDRSEGVVSRKSSVNGIKTGMDKRWVSTQSDRTFGIRSHYRPFDNRWLPRQPPKKVARTPKGQPPLEPGSGQTRASGDWRLRKLFNPHSKHIQAGGWYIIAPATSTKPGPALHASRHLPDYHCFKGSEGARIVRVANGASIPVNSRDWADRLSLSSIDFWFYALAAAHHQDYWTAGTLMAEQLAATKIEPIFADDYEVVNELVKIGGELLESWSLDDIQPVDFVEVNGKWEFEGEKELANEKIHDKPILKKWKQDRPNKWDMLTAKEYARSIAAIHKTLGIANRVKKLLS